MTANRRIKPTTALILIMMAVVAVALIIARSYYSQVNAAADPRVVPARLAYQTYQQKAGAGDFTGVLDVLDSIEALYNRYPHYSESYEKAVVFVNRSSVYLTVALHIDSLRITSDLGWMATKTPKGLRDLAEQELNEALALYRKWDSLWGDLSEEQILTRLNETFFDGTEEWSPEEKQRYLESRSQEIQDAQWENDRRISVACTNLGMIWFERKDYEQAAAWFNQAVELWEDNLNAKNNLNRMLGKPLEKRSMIQKLFPKERF